jgi:hypothetical protein
MAKIRPIATIQSMSGKVCEHSDMYFRTNKQTSKVTTGKICNPSTAEPTETQLKVQNRFAKLSAAAQTILDDPTQRAKYETAYKKQRTIGSLKGYVIAKIKNQYDENGDPIA